ncbi:hypothetical protein SAMN04489834_3308 [Microterricola viridarii]|uniref:Uncharacterized protein n=2 Tax=Microterricola viridarii TaxID=412690 RepID=A0A1H1Z456_9MICO|nr:hypothetical protein SAMN04489834_3308 [Microterricola viridarii]
MRAEEPQREDLPTFSSLVGEVMATAERFGHREHVHLTWLAVSRCGVDTAIELVSAGIQNTARSAGMPQKYHETMTRAWVVLVGHASTESSTDDFTEFVARHPELLDTRLLMRHYHPSTLASAEARLGWVEPDLAPLEPAVSASS